MSEYRRIKKELLVEDGMIQAYSMILSNFRTEMKDEVEDQSIFTSTIENNQLELLRRIKILTQTQIMASIR
jgi:hypothetical protein